MTQDDIHATEKALLLVTLGYLEALKAASIHPDEAFHTIGIPMIVKRMAARGVSETVAELVGGLDEFEAIWRLSGEAERRRAIEEAIELCHVELLGRPLKEERANVCLRLLEVEESRSA